MILFHGSNVETDAIDFDKSKPGKDFGVGFYLSPDEDQAYEMAVKKARLLGGNPIVTRYEFDEDAAKADDVAYLRYERYSLEWGAVCSQKPQEQDSHLSALLRHHFRAYCQ